MQVVLNTTGAYPFLAYLNDPNSDIVLPDACEVDIAVSIQASTLLSNVGASATKGLGLVVSYANPSVTKGAPLCRDRFVSGSGNVTCYQNGYDGGISQQSDAINVNVTGYANGLFSAQGCVGTGACFCQWCLRLGRLLALSSLCVDGVKSDCL